MTVKEVQMWQCPITHKLFTDKQKAQNCERSAKAARTKKQNKEKRKETAKEISEERSNYLINNASSLNEIFDLMIEKSKEFWGIEFIEVKVDRTGPIVGGADKRYMRFTINAKTKPLSTKSKNQISKYYKLIHDATPSMSFINISNLFLGEGKYFNEYGIGFYGIGTGSGCPGSFGEIGLSMDGKVYIDMFPNIKRIVDRYEQYCEDKKRFDSIVTQIEREANVFSRRSAEHAKLHEEILTLEAELLKKKNDLGMLSEEGIRIYKKIAIEGISHLEPKIDEEVAGVYRDLCSRFHFDGRMES